MKGKSAGLSKAFAIVLSRRRKAKNLSRQVLAESAGLHQTYVGLLERGLRNPSLDVADKLANALGEKLSGLLAEAEMLQEDRPRSPNARRDSSEDI